MANSITFNGTDLTGADYELTVLDGNWNYCPPVVYDLQQVSNNNPYIVRKTSNSSARTFTLNCRIEGTSNADVQTKMNNLSALFAQQLEKPIIFDDYRPDYYFNGGYISGLENVLFLNDSIVTTTLTFLCSDPLGFSNTVYDNTATSTNQTTFTMTEDPVGGNYYTNPTYIIKPGATSSAVIYLNNYSHDPDETIYYTATLGVNDWLRINTETQYVDISSNSGVTWAAAMIPVSGVFPRFKVGRNSINVTGVPVGGTVEYTWNTRIL